MEHRQGLRKSICVDAIAEFARGGSRPARITDVSLTGVYVACPTGQFAKYTSVTLHFRLNQRNKVRTYRWRGFVTRLEDGGMGAAFESSDPADQSGLLALLVLADEAVRDVLSAAG